MPEQHFIVATAGHVDHGKSSVVKVLTGIDPDRLPEEKARGITIDLGFAHLDLPSPTDPALVYKIGIVDVPGHEDFVKNMVAGVGAIDLALFIIAADDGWMPQTEEHLQILTYLGVTRAVIALTKIDLVDSRELVIEDVQEHLAGSPFASAPIIPTSIINGTGFAELKSALARVLSQALPPRDIGKPRLSVDRVFTLRGIGTVVTGTLTGGCLHRGEIMTVQPSNRQTKVRSIQSHNRDVATVQPGTRTALNVPDLESAAHSPNSIQRGDVITISELAGPITTMDVLIEKSARLKKEKGPGRPLKDGARVRWHHGSANAAARLLLKTPVRAGESAIGQLRFESPVFALAGERYILRDWAEQSTLGGGVILDTETSRENFRSADQQSFLVLRSKALDDVGAWVESQLNRDHFTVRGTLLLKSVFGNAEIESALSKLSSTSKVIVLDRCVADAAWWQDLRSRAVATIDSHHKTHPELTGFSLQTLRSVLAQGPQSGAFDSLLAELCRNEFTHADGLIRRRSHKLRLPPELERAAASVAGALAEKPLEPPSRKEVAPDVISVKALQFLIDSHQAIELGEEVVLLHENYLRAVELVKDFIRAHGPATVSELRQAVGASRRIVVPLLEKLDKENVTRRIGDKRELR